MGLALIQDHPALAHAAGTLWRRSLPATYVEGGAGVVALGGSAALLWELFEDPSSVDDAVLTLADLFERPAAAIAPDVSATVADLVSKGLLTAAPPTRTGDRPPTRHRDPSLALQPTDDPLAALAAWDLPGSPLALPDPAAIGTVTFAESIRRERLSGLAVAAHRSGALPLDDDLRGALGDAHRDAMVTCLRLERRLLELLDLLEHDGVEPVVIKGPAIAHRYYDDPAVRPFGDIDLLIPADQLDHAYELLTGAGHVRRYPQPRPGFDRRFGKGAAFVAPDGLEVDVHRTFAAGPFGITALVDDAHRDVEQVIIGDRSVRVLAGPATLVSVAMHAVLGTRLPRLLNLRDVAQVASHVDADPTIELALRWRVDAAVALALRHAATRFALANDTPLLEWASDHVGTRAQRRALSAYTSPHRSYARQAFAALPALPGTRARVAYVRAMVLPDRSYVVDRDGSQGRRWVRMARALTRPGR